MTRARFVGGATRVTGYTLIEVMIALFVMSIGLLAMVTLQVASMRDTITALNRTRAILLTNDIAERILANKNGINDYVTPDLSGIPAAEPNPSCAGAGANDCSSGELAAHDLWHWKTLVNDASSGLPRDAAGVPTGDASITVAGVDLKTVTITMQWQDQGELQQFTAAFQVADSI